MRNVGKPLVPDALRDQLVRKLLATQDLFVHTHHEHFLVVRAVKDADPAALRQALDVAPQKVVVEVLSRWLLERKHLAPLWIDSRHYVLDRAVFSRGVHRLEEEKQR